MAIHDGRLYNAVRLLGFFLTNGIYNIFVYILVAITKTWNGASVKHLPVRIVLEKATGGLNIRVNAPFFNDPGNPGGQPGQPFDGLWDYEGNHSLTFSLLICI